MNASELWRTVGSRDGWGPLLAAHAPQVVTWVLVVALAVQAALIVTNLGGANVPSSTASPSNVVASTAPTRRVDLAAIVNAHLFGQAPTATADPANAPQTSAPLVLAGVIADEDPEKGLAIVGQSASGAKVYAVGDAIPGGVRLRAVYADRVLLDRNGAVESLPLPRRAPAAPGSAPPPPPVAAAPAPPSGNPSADRVRQLVEENPSAFGDIMRPQPVFAQGKQRGYRIYPGPNRSAFVQLGLRPGDLVTAINGTPLDDPARGMEIFRTLGSSAEARVTITRNGRQQDLVLNLAQAAATAEQIAGTEGMAPVDQMPPVPADPAGTQ